MVVALDARFYNDVNRGCYNFCFTLPGGSKKEPQGGVGLIAASEGEDQLSCWVAGAIETGCRALLELEEKGFPDEVVTIQADCDLSSLLKREWAGNLGVSVRRFRAWMESGHIRLRNKAGKWLEREERMALDQAMREALLEAMKLEETHKLGS